MASSKEVDLGSTVAFSKVGDTCVIELKIPQTGCGGETGKSALDRMPDGTHG